MSKKARILKNTMDAKGKMADKANTALSASRKNFMTTDGYNNVLARLGINGDNMSAGGNYDFGGFITRNRLLLDAAYRTSWIIGRVVDARAEDMTRAGAEIISDLNPEETDTLQRELEDLDVWHQLTNTIKWARLYGGAAAVILVEGQKMEKPLDLDTIGIDSFRGLLVLDRWLFNPSLGDLVQEFGPDFGMPEYYDIIATSTVLHSQRVHYSRIIRFDGIELPYLWKQSENLWSESVVERLWDRLLAFDSTTQGAAQLVYKAHLRTVGVEGLREILAAGGDMEKSLIAMFEYIRRFQSNEGITLLDAKDEFQTHQYAFAGLDSILNAFAQQICGATKYPNTILFGNSPGGLGSNGDAEIRSYYDSVASDQKTNLKLALLKIVKIAARSKLGVKLPETTTVNFNPLWQMTEKEKSEIASTDAATITSVLNAGAISVKTALQELRQGSRIHGRFTNITDKEIDAADDTIGGKGEGGEEVDRLTLSDEEYQAKYGKEKPKEKEVNG